jgi:hypothetical protein
MKTILSRLPRLAIKTTSSRHPMKGARYIPRGACVWRISSGLAQKILTMSSWSRCARFVEESGGRRAVHEQQQAHRRWPLNEKGANLKI